MAHLLVCARDGCHHVFEPHQGQKYCSNACRQKAYRNRGGIRRNRIPFMADKWCRNCGFKFFTENPQQIYCSDACKQQHYRDRKALLSLPDQEVQNG